MALYIPHSIFHLARLLYIRPETFGLYYVYIVYRHFELCYSFAVCQETVELSQRSLSALLRKGSKGVFPLEMSPRAT